MTTEDIKVPSDQSWTELAPVDTDIIVYNDTRVLWKVRLGTDSKSHGVDLVPKGTVMASESIFISSEKPIEKYSGSLRVTR